MSDPPSEPSDAKGDNDTAQPKASDTKPFRSKQSLDDLPHVASPSISPAGDALKIEEVAGEQAKTGAAATDEQSEAATAKASEPASEPALSAKAAAFPRVRLSEIKISRRFKRAATNAAAIAAAAGIGAIASALAISGLAPGAPKQEAASVAEQHTMQKSIALLAEELSALKSSIETASKSSQTPVSKTAARVDGANSVAGKRDDNMVTGSVNAPASALQDTIAAATAATIAAPLPQPRPPLVQGWSIHQSPDGLVFVEQRGGDLFLISPGMPLPGLGRVEAIHREGGRIEVVTTNGIITSSPRRTVRNRNYRFPPYFEPY